MISKKVLENIRKRYSNSPTFQTWCDIIQQDLDRLEKLEKFVDIYKYTNQRFIMMVQAPYSNLPNPTMEQELIRLEVLNNDK